MNKENKEGQESDHDFVRLRELRGRLELLEALIMKPEQAGENKGLMAELTNEYKRVSAELVALEDKLASGAVPNMPQA
ncbi:MAG: hypothetical protein AAB590_03565 [Patescibacteria group bacterium]